MAQGSQRVKNLGKKKKKNANTWSSWNPNTVRITAHVWKQLNANGQTFMGIMRRILACDWIERWCAWGLYCPVQPSWPLCIVVEALARSLHHLLSTSETPLLQLILYNTHTQTLTHTRTLVSGLINSWLSSGGGSGWWVGVGLIIQLVPRGLTLAIWSPSFKNRRTSSVLHNPISEARAHLRTHTDTRKVDCHWWRFEDDMRSILWFSCAHVWWRQLDLSWTLGWDVTHHLLYTSKVFCIFLLHVLPASIGCFYPYWAINSSVRSSPVNCHSGQHAANANRCAKRLLVTWLYLQLQSVKMYDRCTAYDSTIQRAPITAHITPQRWG